MSGWFVGLIFDDRRLIDKSAFEAYLEKNIGSGFITATGSYNYKKQTGQGQFAADISNFPNPFIQGQVFIDGDTKSDAEKTNLQFSMKSDNSNGTGTISISKKDKTKPPRVDGLLELTVGSTQVMLQIEGDMDEFSIKARQ